MNNTQRPIVRIVQEICAEEGISCESFSYDWIFRLSRQDRTAHIYGYQFGNNSAATQLICTDKSATSDLLAAQNIPVVKHHFFISPADMDYIGVQGNWQRLLQLLADHKKIVCKPNGGTGGIDVFLVTNQRELEQAVTRIFQHSKTMAVSAWLPIEAEYRVILLNQQVQLVFAKHIPLLTGDGRSSVRQLLLAYGQTHPELPAIEDLSSDFFDEVPVKGAQRPLHWKHNLGQGALPVVVEDTNLVEKLSGLAIQAAGAVNARFASVDIIQVSGDFMVLEINSGIMMDYFARQNVENYTKAKAIYGAAIRALMET